MSIIPGRYFHDPFCQQVWDPFQDFPFGSSRLVPPPFPSAFSSTGGAPPFELTKLEWTETPEAHVFRADLPPGVNKNHVKVEVVDGRVLCISGEKRAEKEVKSERFHRVEFSSGTFVRRFSLPENAKVDKLNAYLENGILTITIPKNEAIKHHANRTIQIHGN